MTSGISRAGTRSTTTTQYLLSVHSAGGAPNEQMTNEQMQQGYAQVGLLESDANLAGGRGELRPTLQLRPVSLAPAPAQAWNTG